MDRRDFIKGSLFLAPSVTLASCAWRQNRTSAGQEDSGEMEFRLNPKTGEKVSLLGFGCMRFPFQGGTGTEDDKNLPIDQEAVNRMFDRAIECGLTYFDTAPVYCRGFSEKAVGVALSRYDRSRYTLATKLSNFSPSAWSREASMQIYRNSFKELQTEYIDYYLLHSVGGGKDAMETFRNRFIDNGMLDFLLEEREKGHIRNLGFSYHGDIKVFDYLLSLNDVYHWDFVQIQMNYVDWSNAKTVNPRNTNSEYLYGELDRLGIPVVIMEPLLGGRLASVPRSVASEMLERNPDGSVASWAFRFCGSFPRVLTVLSGMTYMEHLDDNLKTFRNFKPLDGDDMEFIRDMAGKLASYPAIPCNDCGYCMPCPYGIDIPGIIRHYNKCVNEGYIEDDIQDPGFRKARRKYLSSYAEAVVPERAADKCIGCGQCIPKCPQRIDIPKELGKIDCYVEKLRKADMKLKK